MTEVVIETEDARLVGELHGEAGPLVIASHGFPDGPSTWRKQVPVLVEAGFRVVTPWMRGYAPSGAGGAHDVARLGRDVLAWAEALSPEAPVDLLGHDWGAIAGYAAAGLAPKRVRSFVAIAVPPWPALIPAGITAPQIRRSWYILFFQLPRWPEVALCRPDGALVARLWKDWSPDYDLPFADKNVIVASIAANPAAVVAPYRALYRALSRHAPVWRRVVAPSLYLHGVDDGCLGIDLVDGVEVGFDDVTVRRLPGGHWVHLEHADVPRLVADHLLAR